MPERQPTYRGFTRPNRHLRMSSTGDGIVDIRTQQPHLTRPLSVGNPHGSQFVAPEELPLDDQDITPLYMPLTEVKGKPAMPRQRPSYVLKRHAVSKNTKKYRAKPSKKLILLAPVLLFLIGGTAFAVARFTMHEKTPSEQSVLGTQTTTLSKERGVASEEPLPADSLQTYTVAADLPRILRIPKIGVAARVKSIHLGASKELLSPETIYDVGWYDGGAKPGNLGAVVLNGFVSGSSNRGVFYSIANLAAGDAIQIELGDGKKVNYKVVTSEKYDNDVVDMKTILKPAVDGKPGLSLVTAPGRFDIKTNKYEPRIVVFAVQE